MSFCLNPHCPHPENPATAQFCQGCGQPLWVAGRYRPMRLLGQGGQGRTWLADSRRQVTVEAGLVPAQPEVSPQWVVIKQRWRTAHPSPDLDFQDEAKRLHELGNHPQIPQLLDVLERPWGQLLIQEYIEGPNLEQLLVQEGPFSAARIQSLLKDLLPVLEYIQSFRVIHRDIKPENIIQPVLQGPLVLVDFGALSVVPKQAKVKPGTVIGSAEYIAPEQAMGQAVFASDLYSLGVICIHLLTGLPPFELYSIAEDRWVWRDFLAQPLADSLAKVLDKLLARSLTERYETAAQVILALQRPAKRFPISTLLQSPKPQKPSLPKGSILPWHLCYRITQPIGVSSALAVSSDGQRFATGSAEGSLFLWDLPTGALIHSFKRRRGMMGHGHCDRITHLQFSPTGQLLYSASQDGTLKIWNLQNFSLMESVSHPGGFPTVLALTPQGQGLVSASSSGQLIVWRADPLGIQQRLTQHQDRVSALGVSADGHRLASASWDGTVRLWEIPQGNLQRSFKAHEGRVMALSLHPLGNPVVSGGQDGQVKVWHLGSQLTCDVLCRAEDGITALALSADARLVAVGSEGNIVTVWQGTTGDCVSRVPQGWGVVAIAFSPDSKILICTGQDETISVWKREETANGL